MISFRKIVVFICSLAVGGTFVVAGVLKSFDVNGFAHDIALHGIVGEGPSWFLARLLVPVEIVAGAAAILGYRRRLALVVLVGALAVFIGATGYAWSTGQTEGCGCFGRYAARTPAAVIIEDLVLMAAGLLALLLVPSNSRSALLDDDQELDRAAAAALLRQGGSEAGIAVAPSVAAARAQPGTTPPDGLPRTEPGPDGAPRWEGGWRAATIALLAVVSTIFTLASPALPIDNVVTALRPGATIADLGLDRIAGNLGEGDRLLAILVLGEADSQKAVAALNALGQSPGVPPITALTSANEEKRGEFFWSYAPAFEILDVPAADLRRLYRRAPRVFRVHNGAILQVWERIPDVEDFPR